MHTTTSILCMHNAFNLLKYYPLGCIPCTFSIHLSVYCNCSHLDSDITHRYNFLLHLFPFPLRSFHMSDITLILQLSRQQHMTSYTKTTTDLKNKTNKKPTVMPSPYYIYNLSVHLAPSSDSDHLLVLCPSIPNSYPG